MSKLQQYLQDLKTKFEEDSDPEKQLPKQPPSKQINNNSSDSEDEDTLALIAKYQRKNLQDKAFEVALPNHVKLTDQPDLNKSAIFLDALAWLYSIRVDKTYQESLKLKCNLLRVYDQSTVAPSTKVQKQKQPKQQNQKQIQTQFNQIEKYGESTLDFKSQNNTYDTIQLNPFYNQTSKSLDMQDLTTLLLYKPQLSSDLAIIIDPDQLLEVQQNVAQYHSGFIKLELDTTPMQYLDLIEQDQKKTYNEITDFRERYIYLLKKQPTRPYQASPVVENFLNKFGGNLKNLYSIEDYQSIQNIIQSEKQNTVNQEIPAIQEEQEEIFHDIEENEKKILHYQNQVDQPLNELEQPNQNILDRIINNFDEFQQVPEINDILNEQPNFDDYQNQMELEPQDMQIQQENKPQINQQQQQQLEQQQQEQQQEQEQQYQLQQQNEKPQQSFQLEQQQLQQQQQQEQPNNLSPDKQINSQDHVDSIPDEEMPDLQAAVDEWEQQYFEEQQVEKQNLQAEFEAKDQYDEVKPKQKSKKQQQNQPRDAESFNFDDANQYDRANLSIAASEQHKLNRNVKLKNFGDYSNEYTYSRFFEFFIRDLDEGQMDEEFQVTLPQQYQPIQEEEYEAEQIEFQEIPVVAEAQQPIMFQEKDQLDYYQVNFKVSSRTSSDPITIKQLQNILERIMEFIVGPIEFLKLYKTLLLVVEESITKHKLFAALLFVAKTKGYIFEQLEHTMNDIWLQR